MDPHYARALINAQLEIMTNAASEATRLIGNWLCEPTPKSPVKTRKPRRTKAQMAAAKAHAVLMAASEPTTVSELVAPKGIRRARGRKLQELTSAAAE